MHFFTLRLIFLLSIPILSVADSLPVGQQSSSSDTVESAPVDVGSDNLTLGGEQCIPDATNIKKLPGKLRSRQACSAAADVAPTSLLAPPTAEQDSTGDGRFLPAPKTGPGETWQTIERDPYIDRGICADMGLQYPVCSIEVGATPLPPDFLYYHLSFCRICTLCHHLSRSIIPLRQNHWSK